MSDQSLSAEVRDDEIDTGIESSEIDSLADAVACALADSFNLYLKTLGLHWNAVGSSFYAVHKLTQEQYEDLQDAIDEIGERIRALGRIAPASFSQFRELGIVQAESEPASAEHMLSELVADNEAVAKRLRNFAELAADADDRFTEDMLIGRIGVHEKNAWMLRALLA